jgi:CheY-like chemotaxis protein
VKASRTVLIVEDNAAISEMMKTLLEIEGYVVHVACDGQKGIDELQKNTPDVIILDMMMPGVNGWHFLDFQRGDQKLAKIPVIVVSAFGEIAKSVHPDAYLPKPLKLEQLLETVQKYSA